MAGLRGFYEKLKFIVGGTQMREVFRAPVETQDSFYKEAEKDILEKAKQQREAKKLALEKAVNEKRRVAQAKRAIDQAQETSEPVIPESQIEFGTLQPGTGQRLREAEKAGVPPRTLAALLKARINSQKK